MKNWNYWLPRVLAGVVALVVIVVSVPLNTISPYVFLPVNHLMTFSVLWLVAVHCHVHKRASGSLAWIGLLLAVVALAGTFIVYFIEGADRPNVRQMFHGLQNDLFYVGQAIAAILLLLFPRLRPNVRWIQTATVGIFAGNVVASLLHEQMIIYRLGTLGIRHYLSLGHDIIGLLAYIGLFITTYYTVIYHEPMRSYVPVNDSADRVNLECPRCSKPQELPLGRSVCTDCGMGIHIEIEDTKCLKCGYTLRGLTRQMCPECGTAFGMPTGTAI
jgi:hypothetical protein